MRNYKMVHMETGEDIVKNVNVVREGHDNTKYAGQLRADVRGEYSCGECGCPLTKEQYVNSLWGFCSECENDRIGDICAG
jgi:ribosomal protein L37AE/L43A